MIFRLHPRLNRLFSWSVVLLPLAGAAAFTALTVEREAFGWVLHTREVLAQLEATAAALEDARSSALQYVLAGEPGALASYESDRAPIGEDVSALLGLTADNPRQQRSIARLREHSTARRALLDEAIRLRKAGDSAAALAMVRGDAASALQNEIRADIGQIRVNEERLLLDRTRLADRERLMGGGAVMLLAAFALGLLALLRHVSERDRRERERLIEMFRAAPSFMAILEGPDHRYRFVNQAHERLFGARGYLGRPVREVFPELVAQGITGVLDRVLATGERFIAQDLSLNIRTAGEETPHEVLLDFIYEPMRDLTGMVIGIFVDGYDVTERTRAGRALRQSEATLGAVLDALPVGVAVSDVAGRLVRENAAHRSLWGLRPGTPLSHGGVWIGYRPLTGERVGSQDWPMARALSSGESIHGELIEVHPLDGAAKRLVLNSAAPIRDAAGRLIGAVEAELDITKLRESERRYAQVLEALPQLVWTCDARGEADFFSRQWLEYTGTGSEHNLGEGWMACLHPGDRGRVAALWKKIVRKGSNLDAEVRIRDKDGGYRWFKHRAVPLHADGAVEKWFGTSTDITDLVNAREAVEHANLVLETRVEQRTRELEATHSELQAFAHTVAHDLRTPLLNIRGYANALVEDEQARLSDEGVLQARRLIESAVRLDELIQDLLSYSRLSREDIHLQRIDLGAVARDVLQDLGAEIATREAKVTVEGELSEVMGQRTLIERALGNLVSNAIKFVAPDSSPEVRISARRAAGYVHLLVEDNGIGIAAEHHERIFRVFERVHGASQYPGTGIGLAVVRKAVERMGGRVRLDSAPGRGSRFTIELPEAL